MIIQQPNGAKHLCYILQEYSTSKVSWFYKNNLVFGWVLNTSLLSNSWSFWYLMYVFMQPSYDRYKCDWYLMIMWMVFFTWVYILGLGNYTNCSNDILQLRVSGPSKEIASLLWHVIKTKQKPSGQNRQKNSLKECVFC